MTTPSEAEALAIEVVQSFFSRCAFSDREHMANCLMKLVSVAGVQMARIEGRDLAVARLEGTAKFIKKTMPANAASIEKMGLQ